MTAHVIYFAFGFVVGVIVTPGGILWLSQSDETVGSLRSWPGNRHPQAPHKADERFDRYHG